MSDLAIVSNDMKAVTLERVLIHGDLSSLSSTEKVTYMMKVCEMVGLNYLTKPFEFIKLNGKEVLYAKRDATDQLRKVHKVSVKIVGRETLEGVYVVTAQARLPDGREDESTGAVTTKGLTGDFLANAFMKCETKAKRRVTLSICGLGILDETEVETISKDESRKSFVDQPESGDGNTEEAVYRFNFGQYKGRTIEQIYNDPHPKCGPEGLKGYVRYLDEQEKKKPLGASAVEARRHVEEFLGAIENCGP